MGSAGGREGRPRAGSKQAASRDIGRSATLGPTQAGDASTEVRPTRSGPSSSSEGIAQPAWQKRVTKSLKVINPSLLRAMNWTHLLKGHANVLSISASGEKAFETSVPVEHIDTFLSHTWNTPRWKKFLVLILHFNLIPAFIIAYSVATGVCVLTALGVLPVVTVADFLSGESAGTYERGVLCLPLGLVTFIVCLFALHELDRVIPLRRHRVFLDKTCVHQTDAELKKQGIQSLASMVHSSQCMLVMYSNAYMQRLWTTYEIASWLMLHKGKKVVARPLFVPIMVLAGFFFFATTEPLVLIVGLVGSNGFSTAVGLIVLFLLMFPEFVCLSWLSAKWANDREKLEGYVSKFRLSNAQCAREEDRAAVQENILAFMKFSGYANPEALDEEVCLAFEELVRAEVPTLMWSSFGRTGLPFTWVLVFCFPHSLFTFDLVAGLVRLGSTSARGIVLITVMRLSWLMEITPLIVAFVFMATRCRCLRNVPAYVGIALVACFLMAASHTLLSDLIVLAAESDIALAGQFGLCVVLAVVDYLVFRPY